MRYRIGGTAKPPGGFVAAWPLEGRPSDVLVDGRPVARALPGRVTVPSASGGDPDAGAALVTAARRLPSNRYGHFSEDGREYVVTDPRPPRPWTNVIANERVGLAVSHTRQRLLLDRQLAARGGDALAAGPRGGPLGQVPLRRATPTTARSGRSRRRPCWAPLDRFACRHGFGYTVFETEPSTASRRAGRSSATPRRPSSSGRSSSPNASGRAAPARARRLSRVVLRRLAGAAARVRAALPRDRGTTRRAGPSSRATTCGTSRRRAGATGTRASRTSAPSRPRSPSPPRRATRPRSSDATATCDAPRGARDGPTGRRSSAVTTTRSRRCAADVELAPGGAATLGFVLATGELAPRRPRTRSALRRASVRWTRRSAAVRAGWRERLAAHRIETPDAALDCARQRLAALPGDLGAALGRAPATTSRAAPTASATSSRTRRSG